MFAAADAALNSVSRARVDALVRAGRPGSRALAAVVADRPRHVNLLLLLRLAAETAATVLLTVALMEQHRARRGSAALTAGGIMVVVSYVLIGVGPRTLGRQHPYRVGMLVAAPIRALATLLGPLTKLLILIGNAITPGQGFRQGPFSSEVELRELVDMASTSGVVDEDERQMIHSVFELGDTLVREVMVPRPDVVWTERDTPVEKVLRLALKSGYSRIPVLGESIDDIVGVAYLKDLVQAVQGAATRPTIAPADGQVGRAGRGDAARGVRARQQAHRRAAQGDAAHPQPHGDRRRRVRRHRGRGDDRGHPGGDRRRDHRRVRLRGGARRPGARRP